MPDQSEVPDKKEEVCGLPLSQWEAMFRPGIDEFAAAGFSFSPGVESQVRIAFCNQGPVVNSKGERSPVYTHAVTLPRSVAVDLARILIEHYAKPADDPNKPIAPI
jgi:hypothetical protein